MPGAPELLHALVAGVVGACLGSFASLLAHRLPRGQPVGAARSRCPRCGATLAARDLVPLVSWLLSGGRCRHCGGRISGRYPAIEAATAALVLAAWAVFGTSWATVCLAGLATALVVAVVVDLEWLILPDETMIAAAVLGVAWRGVTDQAWVRAGAAAVGLAAVALLLRALFTWLKGREALGLGDVKLMAVAGLWLPVLALPWFFIAAGGLGLVTAALWRTASGSAVFPFGPGLAAGLYVTLLAGGLGLLP